MASPAADLRDDVQFAFGYSGDLGYPGTGALRDSDGISAGLALLSATEPAIKAHLEVVQPVLLGKLEHARDFAAGRMSAFTTAVRALLAN